MHPHLVSPERRLIPQPELEEPQVGFRIAVAAADRADEGNQLGQGVVALPDGARFTAPRFSPDAKSLAERGLA